MALLDVNNVSVQFGGLRALDNVSLHVEKGDFIGLIGPNGAGKTTLFNAITGVVPSCEGTITFDGEDIKGKRPDLIALLGIGRTFQNIRLFPKMKVHENVEIGISRVAQYSVIDALLGTKKKKQIDKECHEKALYYLEKVGILEFKDAYAGALPYGIQRRLEIARALATEPKILFLDEPAAGMNNEETKNLIGFLKKIHEDNNEMAIVLIEHHLEVVMELCNDITVLNLGKILSNGNPEYIQNDPNVIKAYLGERRNRSNG